MKISALKVTKSNCARQVVCPALDMTIVQNAISITSEMATPVWTNAGLAKSPTKRPIVVCTVLICALLVRVQRTVLNAKVLNWLTATTRSLGSVSVSCLGTFISRIAVFLGNWLMFS